MLRVWLRHATCQRQRGSKWVKKYRFGVFSSSFVNLCSTHHTLIQLHFHICLYTYFNTHNNTYIYTHPPPLLLTDQPLKYSEQFSKDKRPDWCSHSATFNLQSVTTIATPQWKIQEGKTLSVSHKNNLPFVGYFPRYYSCRRTNRN